MDFSWVKKQAKVVLKGVLIAGLPGLLAAEARNVISQAIAEKIKGEASARANKLLEETHTSVILTIAWQNALLLFSLLPVWLLHSPVPFYVAYTCVAGYSLWSTLRSWPYFTLWLRTRTLHGMIRETVRKAIDDELCQRLYHERKVVEFLGPDLNEIAEDVARKLHPDICAALANMGITIVVSFIAFRVIVIPMLEHGALG